MIAVCYYYNITTHTIMIEKLNSTLKFLFDNKDSSEIIFLKDINITELDLMTTENSINIRKMVNERKKVNEIAKYKVGGKDKDEMVYFMSLLTETQLSFFFYDLYIKSNKHIRIKTPSIASVCLDKSSDFKFDGKNNKLSFDLKSQFWKCSTNAVNINYEVHQKDMSQGNDLYIVGIIDNTQHQDYRLSKKVSYFLLSNRFVNENAEIKCGHRGKYYSIDLKYFKEKLP